MERLLQQANRGEWEAIGKYIAAILIALVVTGCKPEEYSEGVIQENGCAVPYKGRVMGYQINGLIPGQGAICHKNTLYFAYEKSPGIYVRDPLRSYPYYKYVPNVVCNCIRNRDGSIEIGVRYRPGY